MNVDGTGQAADARRLATAGGGSAVGLTNAHGWVERV